MAEQISKEQLWVIKNYVDGQRPPVAEMLRLYHREQLMELLNRDDITLMGLTDDGVSYLNKLKTENDGK